MDFYPGDPEIVLETLSVGNPKLEWLHLINFSKKFYPKVL